MYPNDGRVVSNFIMQAANGEDITLYGDGSQTRSFRYVDDLVDGLTRMMAAPATLIGPLNMGNPSEMSIRDLAEKILGLCGGRSKLVFKPLPHDDPIQRQPDIAQTRDRLGWQPWSGWRTGLGK